MPGAEDNKGQPGADDKDEKDLKGQNPDDQDPSDDDDPEDREEDGDGDDELYSDPEKAKAIIKKLRSEQAKHRLKNKSLAQETGELRATLNKLKKALGGEDDDESPEERVQRLQQEKEALQVEVGIARLAKEYDIPQKHDKYFRFRLAEAFEELEEGEELSDETLEEIVEEVKAMGGSGDGKRSTGLDDSGKGKTPSRGDEITVERFVNMNVGEKSSLYVKNRALYDRLFAEAKDKKLLK